MQRFARLSMIRSLAVPSVAIALGLAALGGLAACGGPGNQVTAISDGTSDGEVAAKDLQIEIVSHGFRDANAYLYIGGSRQRLGLAGGNRTSTFKVKWNAQLANAVEARLMAERIGDDVSLESTSIQLTEGARVVWTVSSHFGQTSLEIY
jgi:hypothetical protein